jgi:hypothetical protein
VSIETFASRGNPEELARPNSLCSAYCADAEVSPPQVIPLTAPVPLRGRRLDNKYILNRPIHGSRGPNFTTWQHPSHRSWIRALGQACARWTVPIFMPWQSRAAGLVQKTTLQYPSGKGRGPSTRAHKQPLTRSQSECCCERQAPKEIVKSPQVVGTGVSDWRKSAPIGDGHGPIRT